MIPNGPGPIELDLPETREAAGPFLAKLGNLLPKELGLFGVSPHDVDLLEFRMDCLERLESLQSKPDAEEERAEVVAELEACELAIRELAMLDVAKVDYFATVYRMVDTMEAFEKDERDRRARKAKRWAAGREFLEGIAMESLIRSGQTRFDSPTTSIRVQNNPPKVHYTDAQAVQARFVNVTIVVPADRLKQIKEVIPDLAQYITEKERTFATSEIGRVLKAAVKAEASARERLTGAELTEELKRIERVRGAELRQGKRLVVD